MNPHIVEQGKEKIASLKDHLVNTTALVAASTPIYAAAELGLAGQTNEVSQGARGLAALLGYAGIAYAFDKGRKLSRKIFKINDETKEKIQAVHDSLYTAGFNGITCPILYGVMGENFEGAMIGGAVAATLSLATGPVLGYSLDVAGDLTGIRKNNRIPNLLESVADATNRGLTRGLSPSNPISDKIDEGANSFRKMNPRTKMALTGLLIAGSIGATKLAYDHTPQNDVISPVIKCVGNTAKSAYTNIENYVSASEQQKLR